MSISHHHYHHKRNKHPNKGLVAIADGLVYLVSIGGVIFTLPQVIKIWVGRDVSGLSLVSWVSMLVVSLFWLFYGLAHKDKAIILINIGYSILNIFIVIGILVYQ